MIIATSLSTYISVKAYVSEMSCASWKKGTASKRACVPTARSLPIGISGNIAAMVLPCLLRPMVAHSPPVHLTPGPRLGRR